jgi:hypothetical protein
MQGKDFQDGARWKTLRNGRWWMRHLRRWASKVREMMSTLEGSIVSVPVRELSPRKC